MAGIDMRMTPAEAILGITLHAVKALGKKRPSAASTPESRTT